MLLQVALLCLVALYQNRIYVEGQCVPETVGLDLGPGDASFVNTTSTNIPRILTVANLTDFPNYQYGEPGTYITIEWYSEGIITYWNENAGGVAIIPLWYETSPDAMPYRTGSVMMHVMTDTVDAQRLPEIQGYVCNESFTAQRAIVMTFSCLAQDVDSPGSNYQVILAAGVDTESGDPRTIVVIIFGTSYDGKLLPRLNSTSVIFNRSPYVVDEIPYDPSTPIVAFEITDKHVLLGQYAEPCVPPAPVVSCTLDTLDSGVPPMINTFSGDDVLIPCSKFTMAKWNPRGSDCKFKLVVDPQKERIRFKFGLHGKNRKKFYRHVDFINEEGYGTVSQGGWKCHKKHTDCPKCLDSGLLPIDVGGFANVTKLTPGRYTIEMRAGLCSDDCDVSPDYKLIVDFSTNPQVTLELGQTFYDAHQSELRGSCFTK